MRLTYNLGRFVGRMWARAQVMRDPSWLTPRHQVDMAVAIRHSTFSFYHEGVKSTVQSHNERRIEVLFSCQGIDIASAVSGPFIRGGRKHIEYLEEISAVVAACQDQLLSDCDLDLARVWAWWVKVSRDFDLFIGEELDPVTHLPLRRRLARAHKLARMYPYSYHHREVLMWLFDLGTQWPEDLPSHEQQLSLDQSISEALVISH
jgi:hypothetical protein